MEKFSLGTTLTLPAWETLQVASSFRAETLAETLVGGQAFRWFHGPGEADWTGTWGRHAASLRLTPGGDLEAGLLTGATSPGDVRHYLGLDRLEHLEAALPCRSDPVLATLEKRWRGLSLLRQPPGEALLAFICSANKHILQIRTMLQELSNRFGEPLGDTPFRSLPSWERLSEAPEPGLRDCRLGYRAAHVAGTAAFLKERPSFLDEVADLSTGQAREALLQLPGVGPKVADCVLLFGFGRTEVFPVDTWIARILGTRYPDLSGWDRRQLAAFARIHFGEAAGLAQQWFFSEARNPLPYSGAPEEE